MLNHQAEKSHLIIKYELENDNRKIAQPILKIQKERS